MATRNQKVLEKHFPVSGDGWKKAVALKNELEATGKYVKVQVVRERGFGDVLVKAFVTQAAPDRIEGECQICGRTQVVRNGVLVHHGYTRPGWGFIVGDCYGVGYREYAKASDAIVSYLERLAAHTAAVRNRMKAFDKQADVTVTLRVYNRNIWKYEAKPFTFSADTFDAKQMREYGYSDFASFRRAARHELEQELAAVLEAQKHFTARLEAAPVR